MKLNENGKNEIRKLIEEQVKNIPTGQKLKLKKEILEDLIFYTVSYKENNKIISIIKYPIWTGPFLQKIDLSELSFKNVEWDRESFLNILNDIGYICNINLPEEINFSSTNANIELSSISSNKYISDCNFEGLDLSSLILYLSNFTDAGEGITILQGTNFKNTKLRIITDNEVINNEMMDDSEYIIKNARKNLESAIEEHAFDGCYIDGYLIQDGKVTEQKAPNRREELIREYEKYKDEIIASIKEQSEEKKQK